MSRRVRVPCLTALRALKALRRPTLPSLSRVTARASPRRTRGSKAAPKVGFGTLAGLYLLFFAVYFVSGSGHFYSTDHIADYLTTQSITENRSLAIKPILDTVVGRDGKSYSTHGLGQPVLSTPLYATGRVVEELAPESVDKYFRGADLGDWGGTVPIFFVSLFNQFVTPLTCIVFFLLCLRLGFAFRASLFTTVIFGFGTLTWVSAREYFQHPLETLMLLLSVYVLVANRDNLRPRHALLAGLAFAFGVFTRVNLLLVAPAVFAYVVLVAQRAAPAPSVGKGPASLLARALARPLSFTGVSEAAIERAQWFVLPLVVMLGIMMATNQLRYADPFVLQPVATDIGFTANVIPGLFGYLFSPGRSIFLYSPPTLLGLYFFRRFYRHHRDEAVLFGAIALIYLLLYASFTNWPGGWSWGPRFLVPVVPFLIIPMAYAFEDRRLAAVAWGLAALGAGVQVLGSLVNVSYVYLSDWKGMDLSRQGAFLFEPKISPIPTHFKDLLEGRNIDLWLQWVFRQFSTPVLLLTMSVPLLILGTGVFLLSGRRREPADGRASPTKRRRRNTRPS